jgi:hypothetical protein
MLDVHSPHGAAHTWKDFWIHLGTISIGLLIAIGLEQSVEAIHRLDERHRLEEDLQLEARKNLILMDIDNQYFDATLPWLIQLRNKVEEMRDSGGKVKFDYLPAPKTSGLFWPDAPYWNTAKESAEVGLLPRDEAGAPSGFRCRRQKPNFRLRGCQISFRKAAAHDRPQWVTLAHCRPPAKSTCSTRGFEGNVRLPCSSGVIQKHSRPILAGHRMEIPVRKQTLGHAMPMRFPTPEA